MEVESEPDRYIASDVADRPAEFLAEKLKCRLV
jgi:hypothetical protein